MNGCKIKYKDLEEKRNQIRETYRELAEQEIIPNVGNESIISMLKDTIDLMKKDLYNMEYEYNYYKTGIS